MIKIITCAHNILLMIKLITCAYNNMHFIRDEKRNLLFSMQKYTKNNNPKVVRNRQNRLMIAYKIVRHVIVKNLDLLKNNKQWEY